jgi:PhnB protein
MAEATEVPVGGITPYLTIKDGGATKAIAFYVAAFGAKELFRHPADDGKRLLHARVSINGSLLMLSDDFPEYRGGGPAPDPAGVTMHLQVADADALWNRAIAAGAVATMPLADQFWGDRYGRLQDPFGHSWSIAAKSKPA